MDVESLPVFKGPLCLIETGHDGKLYVIDDVLNQIAKIQKQLNVIAVAGIYRTGKSYLLNRLAGVNRGFPLGDTIVSKTKGIWAWCRPHPYRSNEVLLLLDTEGLGDIKKGDREHDNWIFALATLLSSTIVYNIMGTFDQNALEKVNFITEISKHVKISDNPENNRGSADFDLFFPFFILTIRDFSLQLRIGDKGISSDEYLEDCLTPEKSSGKSDDKYNKPRLCIRKYFKKRKCFTFDRPGGKTKLQKLENLTDDDLDEDFIEDSKMFTDYVLHNCPPKKLDTGQAVDGKMFAVLTQTYVASIRNGRIPCIENALETMAHEQNAQAVEVSLALYLKKMQTKVQLPVSDDKELSEAHHICVNEAIALFLEKAIYDRDHKYQKQANEKMNTEHENLKRKNEQFSESKAQEALTQLNRTIEDKMKQQVYSCAGGHILYQQDIMKLKEEYGKLTGLGCKKRDTLFKFLESKFSEEQTILQADKLVTEIERKAEAERQKAIEIERKMEEMKRLAEIERQKSEDDKRQMAENIKQLEAKQQEQFKNIKQHHDTVIADRLKEQKRLMKEGFVKEAMRLEKQSNSLKESSKPPEVHVHLCSIQ